jgi:glycosyltransferase EpsD
MEAMACGLPAVCSDIRGNRDLIEDGKGGFLVEPKNILGFTQSMEVLFKDISLREGMGKYNKDKVQEYDIGTVLDKMKSVYENLL